MSDTIYYGKITVDADGVPIRVGDPKVGRMTATEALERRIDELCAENEKLRQQVASIIDRSFRTADKMDCLNTENAKLRELVRAAWQCIHTGVSCYDCRLIAGRCTLQTAMRKLGIEEDE